jgi:hypothetical protein
MCALTNGGVKLWVSHDEHTVCQQIALKFVYMFTQAFLCLAQSSNFIRVHNVLLVVVVVVVVVSKLIHMYITICTMYVHRMFFKVYVNMVVQIKTITFTAVLRAVLRVF